MANRVGQQFGHYQLIRLLGKGGFAEVYLGRHIYLGSEAAIKIILNELSDRIKSYSSMKDAPLYGSSIPTSCACSTLASKTIFPTS